MKRIKLVSICAALLAVSACGSDGGSDDFSIDDLVDKNWFYNGWRNDKYGYSTSDVLEVIRLGSNHQFIGMEYSGRRDSLAGSWEADGFTLHIQGRDGTLKDWEIMKYKKNVLSLHDGWGTRDYVAEPGYLKNLSGDAFWLNEYTENDYQLKTTLKYEIKANLSIQEAYALLSDTKRVELRRKDNIASGESVLDGLDFEGSHRIRFYCQVWPDDAVKFDEQLYADNLPLRSYSDYRLKGEWEMNGPIHQAMITWQPYEREDIYYKIEILNDNLSTVYFESFMQQKTDRFTVIQDTKGNINKMSLLKKGAKVKVRLTAILYEPGVDVNSTHADINIQALARLTKAFIWQE